MTACAARLAALAALLLTSACDANALRQEASEAIGTGQVYALHGLEGRWAGQVQPQGADCGPERHGLMRAGAGKFALDPFESTTVISGTIVGDTLSGTLTRTGGEHRAIAISFNGQARSDQNGTEVIEGDLVSGRCRWSVALRRG